MIRIIRFNFIKHFFLVLSFSTEPSWAKQVMLDFFTNGTTLLRPLLTIPAGLHKIYLTDFDFESGTMLGFKYSMK